MMIPSPQTSDLSFKVSNIHEENLELVSSPVWTEILPDDKNSSFRLSMRDKIKGMSTTELSMFFVTSEDLVTQELDKRFEEFGHHTLSEENCCGKTYTIVDYYNEQVPIELQITHRNTMKPTIIADICCPSLAKAYYNFLITYMLFFFITLVILLCAASFLENSYESIYILNIFLQILLFLLLAPILHVELMREVMKRFDCYYFLFWISVFNFADTLYAREVYGYSLGVIIVDKIVMSFVYSLITFIDAIPDVYAGVRAKAGIITMLALYFIYFSLLMMFDSNYWKDAEITFHFQKDWLISDIYISGWLSLTVMLVKHSLHAVFFPHKYVIIAYGLDRKYTGKTLRDMIDHINVVQSGHSDDNGGETLLTPPSENETLPPNRMHSVHL